MDTQEHKDTNGAVLIAGFLVAIGLALAGWFVQNGLTAFRMDDRIVTVKGLAELDVEADLAIWTLNHSGTSNILSEVQQQVENNQNIILEFLKHAGFTPDEIALQPLQAQDLMAQSYRPEGVERGRYIINQMITMRTTDVDKMTRLISQLDTLLKQGVTLTNPAQPTYIFTGLNEIKPKMLEEAVKNARTSAQQFAADSGEKVGKMKQAYQGMFQILPRDPVQYTSEQNQRYKTVRVVSTVDFLIR